MQALLSGFLYEFPHEVRQCAEPIINASVDIYFRMSTDLLPTPAKSHYLFNLRDFARVIAGILLSLPETLEEPSAMKRLWCHEVFRVYYDRLTDSNDHTWLFEECRKVMKEKLNEDFDQLFIHLDFDGDGKVTEDDLRSLMFCDFGDPKNDDKKYMEVRDLDTLNGVVDNYLDEFNNLSKKPMKLVLFRYVTKPPVCLT